MKYCPSYRLTLALVTGCVLTVGCTDLESSDCAGELETILEVSETRARGRCLIDFLEGASPQELPQILDAFRGSRLQLDEIAAGSLASWWASFDPQTAFFEGRGVAGVGPTLWSSMVVREWVVQAPDSAMEVVGKSVHQGEQEWSRSLTHALIQGWFVAERPPEELLPLIQTLTPGRPQKEALDALFERTVEYRGWDTATQMVEAIPEESQANLRQIAFQRLASVLVVRDPERAVHWVTPHVNTSYGRLLLRRLARRWARRDGQHAVEWIRTVEIPVEEKVSIVGESFRVWQNTNTDSAREWLSSQPFSPDLSLAFERAAVSMTRAGEGEAALAVVDRVTEPGAQTKIKIAVGQTWLATAPEEANRWLAKAGLPPAVLAAIRRPIAGAARPPVVPKH